MQQDVMYQKLINTILNNLGWPWLSIQVQSRTNQKPKNKYLWTIYVLATNS